MSVWAALGVLAAVVVLLSIYPGELSWLSRRGTRRLYDCAAASYSTKYRRHDYLAYDEFIAEAARRCLERSSPVYVLDLGCGTGRASLAAAEALGEEVQFTAVDFSPAMLRVFQHQEKAQKLQSSGALRLCESDIGEWLQAAPAETHRAYDLVLLMEVGEFLPDFPRQLLWLAQLCSDGGTLVLTRPAGLWGWFFPMRAQRHASFEAALAQAGFRIDSVAPWRHRYELIRCRYLPDQSRRGSDREL